VTVIDDRTGKASAGCNSARRLLGAIHIEKWGGVDSTKLSEVERIALENTCHVFHFSKEAALAVILPFRYPDACAAIEQGTRADR
jgi:hypothetical protein